MIAWVLAFLGLPPPPLGIPGSLNRLRSCCPFRDGSPLPLPARTYSACQTKGEQKSIRAMKVFDVIAHVKATEFNQLFPPNVLGLRQGGKKIQSDIHFNMARIIG